jgi:hypothetical protein
MDEMENKIMNAIYDSITRASEFGDFIETDSMCIADNQKGQSEIYITINGKDYCLTIKGWTK